MKRVIRLTEGDLVRLVKRVIKENKLNEDLKDILENIDKIIFIDNSIKINYFNPIIQDLNLLNVNDVVCIWSNNEKINIKILEIILDKQNILKSICIGIVMNQLKNNQKYNLLNNIFFRFENIYEIFHANIQIILK